MGVAVTSGVRVRVGVGGVGVPGVEVAVAAGTVTVTVEVGEGVVAGPRHREPARPRIHRAEPARAVDRVEPASDEQGRHGDRAHAPWPQHVDGAGRHGDHRLDARV